MQKLFHQHVLIKAQVTNAPKSEQVLNQWLTELVSDIKMKVCIPARSHYVDAVGNEGLTGAINIETSHIAIHIWDDIVPAVLQCDVYSCSSYSEKVVMNKLNEWGIISYEYMTIDRNSEFKVVKHISGDSWD
jgi:S-adenosylmethionine/arginine decarboxylase-like enzyme